MDIELHALGKHWGKLEDGRYLTVRRHDGRAARIDLQETARRGRAVVVPAEQSKKEEVETSDQ